MLRASPMLMGGGAGGITLPQTVFATSLYTGTGASQTITNGLDLLGSGGLVWNKSRSAANDHNLMDTARGASKIIYTDLTNAEGTYSGAGVTAFNANGFTLGTNANGENQNSITEVAWSFRQAPKFFQIVTYTGDGTSGRQIPHTLGVAPGMVVVKNRTSARNWDVYHRSLGATQVLTLNTTNAATAGVSTWVSTEPTATTFTVDSNLDLNAAGNTYVAYLWAHDPDPSGIISCGSFTTDASGNASVNLGWSPQFVLIKHTTAAANWGIYDTARGWGAGSDQFLAPNLSNAESAFETGAPTATGMSMAALSANATYVYLAIRAPVFTGPTRPQDAFATSLYTGTGAAQTITNGLDLAGKGGLVWTKERARAVSHVLNDTARGVLPFLDSSSTNAEASAATGITAFGSTGYTIGAGTGWNASGQTHVAWSFARKPKFFDVVTYTGDGTSGRQISHALGVAPGMIVVKARDLAANWGVYHRGSPGSFFILNSTNAAGADNGTIFASGGTPVAPTSTVFSIGSNALVNNAGTQYIAYLWAHDPSPDGIVQAGSWAGAGAAVAVNLGWRPQFLLMKTATNTDPWLMFDGSRGQGAFLQPNSNAAESPGPALYFPTFTGTGFSITDTSGNSTQSGANTVYLAIRAPTT